MNILRGVRVTVASVMLICATMLFLDFTGSLHAVLGWVARIQLVPALLALNFGVVIMLLLLTLIFGRLYCSVICPLGIFQDVISRLASLSDKHRRYSYSTQRILLRWCVLLLFCAAFFVGLGSVVALLEPYSIFGRIASNIFAPIYKLGNNGLAYIAERIDSYAFYSVDVVVLNFGVLALSVAMLALVGYFAWRYGRTYCNTICPVGTILGLLSRVSLFKITVDKELCNGCKACVKSCKSSCIMPNTRDIDYTRCVTCFDCIDSCKQGAIGYKLRVKSGKSSEPKQVDNSKRQTLAMTATLLATSALRAEEKVVDGGLAFIEDKQIVKRGLRLVPPGAKSLRNFSKRCTGCGLCVSVCPSHVLRPAIGLATFMQPEMSYERGYCRPECTKCSEVCPSGAIVKVDRAEKSAIQIGHAVVIEKNCVVLTDGVNCGNCARHCPTGAIKMVQPKDRSKYGKRKVPVVDTELCIGCGACENLCPARPFSAIYVEGHAMHKNI